MNETANRIKDLRSRRGYSQEELAERSGLSLRTIQRIENDETEPRGNTLIRLAAALDVTVDELADWELVEDNKTILVMNLSALCFLLNPVLGILIPLIIWLFNKDRIRGLNNAARSLLNFQITWLIVFYAVSLIVVFAMSIGVNHTISIGTQSVMGDISPKKIINKIEWMAAYFYIMNGFNAIMILVNSVRIDSGKRVEYWPAIPIIRK
jgi:transcriptional regulator with XRE-family HTH domain